MKMRKSSVRVSVTLSALAAIGIILGKFLAFNITEFMRFSLENTSIIFVGIVFGPLYGALVGAVQDLVGCLAVGYAINPIITLGCAAIGAVSGGVWRISKAARPELRITLSVVSSHLIGSVLIKSVGLSVFYSLPFTVTVLWRLLNYAIVGAVEIILLCILLKSKQLLSQINKITAFSTGEKFKTLDEASAYARQVSGVFSKPGLERVEALLSYVASPEKGLKVVHVTGTNGKGSFSAMLSAILSSSGLKVGSFTSPYLLEMRESIRIDGSPISEEYMLSLIERLSAAADKMEDKPTEFELLSAAAYLGFCESGVDVAVIECGMGARRDATNVIDSPILSVITSISVDHTAFLGSTEAAIAKEKAGVIKKGCPVLVGRMSDEALEVVKNEAEALNAEIIVPDEPAVSSMTLDGSHISVSGVNDIHLPLLGVHQPYNASLAVKAARILSSTFPTVTEESIREGIAKTRWPGRFEIICREPIFIYDGAHNLEGIQSAVKSIGSYFDKRIVCLTGVLRDKEYELMADEIAKVAATVVTVTPHNDRALSAEDYATVFLMRGVNARAASSVEDGVRNALREAKMSGSSVVVLGSLYLYGDVTKAIKSAIK